jgi:hypothetical protein
MLPQRLTEKRNTSLLIHIICVCGELTTHNAKAERTLGGKLHIEDPCTLKEESTETIKLHCLFLFICLALLDTEGIKRGPKM